MGFLSYNAHPAKDVMGDTGSLDIGGFIASVFVFTKNYLIFSLSTIVFFVVFWYNKT